MLKWEKTPFGKPGFFADAPGIGRYYVRRLSHPNDWAVEAEQKRWHVVLNGRGLGTADTCESGKELAQNHSKQTVSA